MNKYTLDFYKKIIEQKLDEFMPVQYPEKIWHSMRYSVLAGGKRLRPAMVLESCRICGGDFEDAIACACALEMLHVQSLIHDDLPCMDNDDLRRGKPTNHKVFGEGVALLAGDTLLTYAFEVLASNNSVSDKSIRLAALALSKCAGFSGMAGGQMIDLSSMNNIKSFDELKVMHSLKTGALIRCAMLLGYYAACDNPSKDIIDDIESYATNLGIAFQIRDDILDRIADCETLGKPVGSDDKNGKTTSLTFMSVDEAQGLVDSMTKDAIASIEKYYDDKDNRSLIDLANYMVGRNK